MYWYKDQLKGKNQVDKIMPDPIQNYVQQLVSVHPNNLARRVVTEGVRLGAPIIQSVVDNFNTFKGIQDLQRFLNVFNELSRGSH